MSLIGIFLCLFFQVWGSSVFPSISPTFPGIGCEVQITTNYFDSSDTEVLTSSPSCNVTEKFENFLWTRKSFWILPTTDGTLNSIGIACNRSSVFRIHRRFFHNIELYLNCTAGKAIGLDINPAIKLEYKVAQTDVFNVNLEIGKRSNEPNDTRMWVSFKGSDPIGYGSRERRRLQHFSSNYTFYFTSQPQWNLTFEITLERMGFREWLPNDLDNDTTRVKTQSLTLTVLKDRVICRSNRAGELFLVSIDEENPTATRLQLSCIIEEQACPADQFGTDCTNPMDKTPCKFVELHRFRRNGAAICAMRNELVVKEYFNLFNPISGMEFRGMPGIIAIQCSSVFWNYKEFSTVEKPFIFKKLSDATRPSFEVVDSTHFVPLGSPLILNCSTDGGDPMPRFSWKWTGLKKSKSHEDIEGLLQYSLTKDYSGGSVITIDKFTADLEGDYACRATNVRGTATQVFRARVAQGRSIWIYLSISAGVVVLLVVIAFAMFRLYLLQRGKLTALEIELFEQGKQEEIPEGKFAHEMSIFMPYNKEYEIRREDFELGDDILGEGFHGIVFKGRYGGNTVAVKTIKPYAEKSALMALLSELKIMIYLGKHENVVDLIGACTESLRDARVYVLVEFCPSGSLDSFLRENAERFEGQDETGSLSNSNTKIDEDLNRLDERTLLNWARQIARGMGYLESKRVIHGDLATRNVLLYSQRHVKITDFGLSRQLFNFEFYAKKSDARLPWRWLALESLKTMTFTSKSDVWSYGVTLWEMYTFGKLPYTCVSWNPDFVNMLENNHRLPPPKYASDEIYKIMTQCWDEEPKNRPSFQQLHEIYLSEDVPN
ncbi:unnamed protein product [Allacma fusca]|uniref:Vascular endothelial growth factor receptor 3 n=1 Tax=Allacma fusca TaxID=39272 RepID=A0A8J2PQV0_9HEXA|nr:unnamed protein product [Allacma fusca]